MSERLIIDGNAVYEIDEECLKRQEERRQMGRPRRIMRERTNCQERGEERGKKKAARSQGTCEQ